MKFFNSVLLWNYVLSFYRSKIELCQQQKYLIWSKYFGMSQKWPYFKDHVQNVLAQNVAFNVSKSNFHSFRQFRTESISVFLWRYTYDRTNVFFKRSDIKYQILNVKINFAPNIETIKIFFLITYLTIYSLENIIDIYVQTPNMLAFFHAFMNRTQTEISKLKAQNKTTISSLVVINNCVV